MTLVSAGAQEPTLKTKPQPAAPTDAPATLSLSAKLVNLPVIVYDKKGAIETSLTKDDFALQVDGHPQTIKYFDRDQDLPLTLGLLVDVSRSQSSVLDDERKASSTFIDQMVTAPAGRKADQAFVIQFGRQAELLEDLTDSHPKLQAAIQQVDTETGATPRSSGDPNDPNNPSNTGNSGNTGNTDSSGRLRRGGGTVLYDAIYLSANELMSKQTGRKALIILTDGVDRNSKKTIGEAIEAAQRANVMVFSIYFKGQDQPQQYNNNNGGYPRRGGGYPGGGGGYPGGGGGYPGGGGGYPGGGGGGQRPPNGGGGDHVPFVDGKKVLERISNETGGRWFEVSRKQKVSDVYTMIAEELRSEYRLGYVPDASTAAEGYHKVDLTIPKDKQAYIQTREGYYTGN